MKLDRFASQVRSQPSASRPVAPEMELTFSYTDCNLRE